MLEPNFSPFPLLTTKRLLPGRIQDKDAAALLSLRSDEKVTQYIDKERTKLLPKQQL